MRKIIVFLLLLVCCSPAWAVTKSVDTYSGLKEALADTSTDVIIVTGNISVEATLEITRGVTIRAADNTQPVLNLTADSGAVINALIPSSGQLTMDGLTITGGKNSGMIMSGGERNDISNCKFTKERFWFK